MLNIFYKKVIQCNECLLFCGRYHLPHKKCSSLWSFLGQNCGDNEMHEIWMDHDVFASWITEGNRSRSSLKCFCCLRFLQWITIREKDYNSTLIPPKQNKRNVSIASLFAASSTNPIRNWNDLSSRIGNIQSAAKAKSS